MTDRDGSDRSLRAEAFRGVVWTAAERWIVRVVSLSTFVLLARLLDPSDFGLVALAMTFVGILTTVAEAGISAYIIQADKITDRLLSTTFWTALALSVGAFVVLVAVSPLLETALGVDGFAPVLAALSLTLIGVGLVSVPVALLQRDLEFRMLAARQMAAALLGAFSGVLAAVAGAGVWALVAQAITTSVVQTTLLWRFSTWRPSRDVAWSEAVDSLRYGSKVLGLNLLTTGRDQGENLVVGVALGPVALGYWTVATRILLILIDLGVSAVQTVAAPAFAMIKNDRPRLVAAYSEATTAAATVMLPLLVVASLLSPDLVPALFGSQWSKAGDLAAILTLVGVFAVLVNFDRPVYLAIGRPGVELALVATVVSLHLVVVIGAAQFGLTILAFAVLGRAAATWPLRVWALRRVVGIRWTAYAGLLWVAFASAICAAAVVALRRYVLGDSGPALALTMLGGLATYLVAALLLPGPSRHLIRQVLTQMASRAQAAAVKLGVGRSGSSGP